MRSFRAASARACNKSRIAGWLLIAIMSLSAALADEAAGPARRPGRRVVCGRNRVAASHALPIGDGAVRRRAALTS